MELINFNVVVLIIIDLFEHLLQSEAPLFQNFHQVVKDFILSLHRTALGLQSSHALVVVSVIEFVEFSVLDDPVFVCVDFLEKAANFLRLERQVKVFTEVDLEIPKGKVANLIGVEYFEA